MLCIMASYLVREARLINLNGIVGFYYLCYLFRLDLREFALIKSASLIQNIILRVFGVAPRRFHPLDCSAFRVLLILYRLVHRCYLLMHSFKLRAINVLNHHSLVLCCKETHLASVFHILFIAIQFHLNTLKSHCDL